jgi:hypothetical protein
VLCVVKSWLGWYNIKLCRWVREGGGDPLSSELTSNSHAVTQNPPALLCRCSLWFQHSASHCKALLHFVIAQMCLMYRVFLKIRTSLSCTKLLNCVIVFDVSGFSRGRMCCHWWQCHEAMVVCYDAEVKCSMPFLTVSRYTEDETVKVHPEGSVFPSAASRKETTWKTEE